MSSVHTVDASELEALGLYDQASPHADEQLELLEYLVELGASSEDLLAYRHELPGLASVLALRGGPAMTLSEAAARSSLAEETILEFTRAAGFPTPAADGRVFTDGFVTLAADLAGAEALFGEDVVLQLVRVMGAGMARLADAIVSAFLVNIEPGARQQDPVGLGVARANADAAGLLPLVVQALDMLLRQHLIASRRTILGEAADVGYETQQLCVGFVDLVESSALAQRLSTRELGSALGEFERLASDLVTESGGRVVKLIGDEVLFTVPDARTGCAIALALVARFVNHPRVPTVRAGLASGLVMLRDGDVFGPVVNLAARIVAVGKPNDVVVPLDLAVDTHLRHTSLGAHQLKGFDQPIELCRIEQ